MKVKSDPRFRNKLQVKMKTRVKHTWLTLPGQGKNRTSKKALKLLMEAYAHRARWGPGQAYRARVRFQKPVNIVTHIDKSKR